MNKEIKFGFPGGFPFIQDMLAHMQTGVKSVADLGKAICAQQGGNYLIISGCETIGNAVTEGVVIVAGEVLPFAGGTAQDKVVIKETTQSAVFLDGQLREVYITRTLVFGTGAGEIEWSKFNRIASHSYDYVVDSDEKLQRLHNNPLATNVLIKRGTWRATGAIDLAAETMNITGENGAILELTDYAGINGPLHPDPDARGCDITNVEFHFIAAARSSGGISNFANITNCNFYFDGTNDGEDNQAPLIGSSRSLSACTIKCIGNEYKELVSGVTTITNCVFIGTPVGLSTIDDVTRCRDCTFQNIRIMYAQYIENCTLNNTSLFESMRVSNCDISTNRPMDPEHGIVEDCFKVTNCHYKGSVASPYVNSYASATAVPQYACADTPSGGFNSIER